MDRVKEKGLGLYKKVETRLNTLQDKIAGKEENGELTGALVDEYNKEVDRLAEITKQYGL